MTTNIETKETLTYYQWKERFIQHIVNKLVGGAASQWSLTEARKAAEGEFYGSDGFDHIYENYENDPEASADESLSCWSDEG